MNLLLEAYERAQTDRVTKESAVKLIVFFLDTIKLHDYANSTLKCNSSIHAVCRLSTPKNTAWGVL
jgi:hypothetical protein